MERERERARFVFPQILKVTLNPFGCVDQHTSWWISVYISEMRYYVHYLHFSDYCPHLCRHVHHNVSAVIRTGLLQVVGMSNLALYFAHRGRLFKFLEPCFMDVSYQLSLVNFPSESFPLPSPGIELTVFGYVTGFIQRLYSQWIKVTKMRTIVQKYKWCIMMDIFKNCTVLPIFVTHILAYSLNLLLLSK